MSYDRHKLLDDLLEAAKKEKPDLSLTSLRQWILSKNPYMSRQTNDQTAKALLVMIEQWIASENKKKQKKEKQTTELPKQEQNEVSGPANNV